MKINNNYQTFVYQYNLKKKNTFSFLVYCVKPQNYEKKKNSDKIYYPETELDEYRDEWEFDGTATKQNPWLIPAITNRALYKFVFFRDNFKKKEPMLERKKKIYTLHWENYVSKGGDFPEPEDARKRRVQIQPTIRYYLYLPYFEHIPLKKFLCINKKLRKKVKTKGGYNEQLNKLEFEIKKVLTRTNLSVEKKKCRVFIKKQSSFFAQFECARIFGQKNRNL